MAIEMFDNTGGHDQHDAFERWKAANPDGYVINVLHSNTAMLHTSRCAKFAGPHQTPAAGKSRTANQKICSTDREELTAYAANNSLQLTTCASCHPVRYYLFNIGGHTPTDAWWQLHIDESFISVGFIDNPEQGRAFLEELQTGDYLLAWAKGHGLVGLGVVGGRYWYVTDDSVPSGVESEHRHRRAVDWQIYVDRLEQAIPVVTLKEAGAKQFRLTKTQLGPAVARRIVELLAVQPTASTNIFTSEVTAADTYAEGAVRSVLVDRYERNAKARAACIARWGLNCHCCGMDFKAVYGEVGDGFIHVHHLRPLSEIGVNYCVDPVNDLRPVCPNCHAMLHRNPAASIALLRDRFKLTNDARDGE